MTCQHPNGCSAFAWRELDRELGLTDVVCIVGHRITQQAPLPDPREEPPASVLRQRKWRARKAKSQGVTL